VFRGWRGDWEEEGGIGRFECAAPFLPCWAIDRGLGFEIALDCDRAVNVAFSVNEPRPVPMSRVSQTKGIRTGDVHLQLLLIKC
jgi:hypothetical protein